MIKELFFLFRCQINSENIFLEGFKQVFFVSKKGHVILFENTRLKKKTHTRKGVKQKRRSNKNSFTKRDEQMKKEVFFFFKKKKNKGDSKSFEKKKIQKKHKRESINIRRRNMERTKAKMH